MTVFVPFDGSPLSEAALDRAWDIDYPGAGDVAVMTVVPDGNVKYARERGWIAAGEAFDAGSIRDHLAELVADVAPDATFTLATVGRFAAPGTIASRLRKEIRRLNPTLVVVGSENAGRLVSSLSSVSVEVASETAHDVLIVRNAD